MSSTEAVRSIGILLYRIRNDVTVVPCRVTRRHDPNTASGSIRTRRVRLMPRTVACASAAAPERPPRGLRTGRRRILRQQERTRQPLFLARTFWSHQHRVEEKLTQISPWALDLSFPNPSLSLYPVSVAPACHTHRLVSHRILNRNSACVLCFCNGSFRGFFFRVSEKEFSRASSAFR